MFLTQDGFTQNSQKAVVRQISNPADIRTTAIFTSSTGSSLPITYKQTEPLVELWKSIGILVGSHVA